MKYRDYWIEYDPPPIPDWKAHAWSWVHDGYDGPGDPRHGRASTVAAAIEQIEEMYTELEEAPESPQEALEPPELDFCPECGAEARQEHSRHCRWLSGPDWDEEWEDEGY